MTAKKKSWHWKKKPATESSKNSTWIWLKENN